MEGNKKKRAADTLESKLLKHEISTQCILKCSTTIQSEGDRQKWFEGKWICLRGKDSSEAESYADWDFIMVSAECLHQCFIKQKNIKINFNWKKSQKKLNHSLHHSSPFHLALPQISVMEEGVYEASWVVLGSLIYFFGALGETETTDQIYYLDRKIDGSFPTSMGVTDAGCMITGRSQPKVVALDGKVYVFGGDDSKNVFGEVFEPSLNSFSGQSRQLSSPTTSSSTHSDVLFAVAIEKLGKIVVGINYKNPDAEKTPCGDTIFLVYDVVKDSWVDYSIDFSINLRSSHCQPIAVESCLYWLDSTKMRAYDLITREHFEGPIKDNLFQLILETPCDLQVSLIHLGEDKFCMTWVDYRDPLVLHCTILKVRRTTTCLHGSNFNLRVVVFSCESFTSTVPLCLRDRALVL